MAEIRACPALVLPVTSTLFLEQHSNRSSNSLPYNASFPTPLSRVRFDHPGARLQDAGDYQGPL